MNESTQHKLDRVRSPRVQLTYDVEIGDSNQKKELPFVVGVLADLSGMPKETLPRLRDRSEVSVDRDNLDSYLESQKPRICMDVPNKLTEDGSMLRVDVGFSKLEDFEPHRLVERIEPLRELMEIRNRLAELLTRLDGNETAREMLESIVSDQNRLRSLESSVNLSK